MKRAFMVSILVALLLAPVLMLGQTSKADQELRQLHSTFIEAVQKADLATLDKIVANDFVFVRYDGSIQNKQFLLKNFQTGRTSYTADTQDVKTRLHGQTGVITTLDTITGQLAGQSFSGQMRQVFLCEKHDGRWVIVFRQMTAVAPPGQTNKAEQQIIDLHKAMEEALHKGDIATIDKYLADDFAVIIPNGSLWTKADLLNAAKNGRKHEVTKDADVKVRIYGNTAVLTIIDQGTEPGPATRNTYIWVKRNGQWVSTLAQLTAVAPPRESTSAGK
jgi:ketosteroid isomerase-like protein